MRRISKLVVALALSTAPLFANADNATGKPIVGVLVAGKPDPEPFWRIFRQGLRDLGYVDGKTVVFDFRSAEGRLERLDELASDLVRRKVDVIVTWQTPTARAAKRATNNIPIVMADSGDPVGTGLIASLSRPGGNVTGIAGVTAELAGKSIELIADLLPSARRIAVLLNVSDPFSKPFSERIQQAAQARRIAIHLVRLNSPGELEAAFASLTNDQIDAVIVQPSLPTKRAAELALQHHIPSISVPRWFAEEGGLMSYSPRYADIYREAAVFVDKIIKGAKPADLPVQQPTKFELVINLKTAKALGIKVPPSVAQRADELIR